MNGEHSELIHGFVNDLNEMTNRESKNHVATYASAGMEVMAATNHRITFTARWKQNMWQIMGVARRFIFFKKYFPLVNIIVVEHSNEKHIRFDGLFTDDLKDITYDTDALKNALDTYLSRCESASPEVFTKS